MKKACYTESQVLKQWKQANWSKEVCRKYGISDATYYNSKAELSGLEASDIKRQKDLEDENRRLKAMFADLSLENRVLKDIVEKNCKDSSKA